MLAKPGLDCPPRLWCQPVVHVEDDHSTVECHVGQVPGNWLYLVASKLDGVDLVDNRPSLDRLHYFVKKIKKIIIIQKKL